MSRFMPAFLAVAALVGAAELAWAGQSDQKKERQSDQDKERPIQADVVIKAADKVAAAKVGQVIEVQIADKLADPGQLRELKVSITGAALGKNYQERDITSTAKGGDALGEGRKCVYLKAERAGEGKVKVEYMMGGKEHTREYVIEVK
jgi:hypothetical protein